VKCRITPIDDLKNKVVIQQGQLIVGCGDDVAVFVQCPLVDKLLQGQGCGTGIQTDEVFDQLYVGYLFFKKCGQHADGRIVAVSELNDRAPADPSLGQPVA
jgi:hypothetical protein